METGQPLWATWSGAWSPSQLKTDPWHSNGICHVSICAHCIMSWPVNGCSSPEHAWMAEHATFLCSTLRGSSQPVPPACPVSPNSSMILWSMTHSSQFCVIYKLTDRVLCPSITERLNTTGRSTDKWVLSQEPGLSQTWCFRSQPFQPISSGN